MKNKALKYRHLSWYNRTQKYFSFSSGICHTLISDQSSHTNVCFESHVIWRERLLYNNVIAHLNSRGFYTSVNINTMQMMIYWFSFIYDLLFIASCRANVRHSLCSSDTEKGCRTVGSAVLYFLKNEKASIKHFSIILWKVPSSI